MNLLGLCAGQGDRSPATAATILPTRRGFLCAAAALMADRGNEFTGELWASIASIFAQTLAHPFLKGLADGSLPRPRFQFYLTQDALYLAAFSKALSVLAAKAPREEWSLTLNRHAIESLEVERGMHQTVLASYGVSAEDARRAVMAPTNYAYTNHILVAVERGSFAEGLAAVLPCYWVYLEVGRALRKSGSRNPDYQRWIDEYSSEEYSKSVHQVLAMMNAEAPRLDRAGRRRLVGLFTLSARYEYLFWDMAWRQESWAP